MAGSKLIATYQTLERVPLVGKRLFSFSYQLAAPYFLTIPAQITDVVPGVARGSMPQTPWVRNHLGTVHAIALCNLAEFTMGAVAEATVPQTHRWVPKGMTVEYQAKARGAMRAVATVELPHPLADRQEVPVQISITDHEDVEVFTGEIRLWVTLKPLRGTVEAPVGPAEARRA
jgi:acyl-coenzyme A thioesterase PaaI-like protein